MVQLRSGLLHRVVAYLMPRLIVLLSLSCVCPDIYAAGIAKLTLQSEPGDFIGAGGSFDITYMEGESAFFAAKVRRTIGAPPGRPAEVDFALGTVTSGTDNTFALLFFGTDQLGIPLAPGVYPNAQRADFAAPGFAGLDVEFQNRGCDIVTGSFTVTQAVFGLDAGGNPTIQRFAATFVQHCEALEPALHGTFYFDASGVPPPPPPEASLVRPIPALSAGSLGGMVATVAALGATLLRRRA